MRCASNGDFGQGLIHVGFVSPPLAHTGAELSHWGITAHMQKLRAGKTWGYIVMFGAVWVFLNLLFRHYINIHKADILKIIYYYFLLIIGTAIALSHGK